MTMALLLASIPLAFLLALTTFVQTLYLESLRLRTRDLPSLQFFKDTLEDRLAMKDDDGALTYSLLKHSILVLLGIMLFAGVVDSGGITGALFAEAILIAWLGMILIAYVVPQILYRRTSGHWLLPLVPLFRVLAVLAMPMVGLLNALNSLIDLAHEQPGQEEPPSSAENIEALISAGTEEGLIEEDDRQLIQSVVEFGDKVVREVMTPRPNMVGVSADDSFEQLRQLVIHEQYSRIPVYETSVDQIVGFMHVRDMFELEEDERAVRKIRELMRPIRFVPETKPVNDLMREMQQEGSHMVIVVDEYGNTAGLVTMEDLVEVILGEIRDEHEPESDVKEDGEGGFVVSGSFDVSRLEDLIAFRAQEDVESTTVGGLVTEWLGRVPQRGEAVEREGVRIEVLASDQLRVEQVRVKKSEVVTT